MQDTPTPQRHDRRNALLLALLSAVLLYFLWNIPAFRLVMAPLRLFVTYVHEAGHALGAILTGGGVQRFLVSPDGSGLAITYGGIRMIVISGGYLGAALFGSLLFVAANRLPRYVRSISIVLGIGMILFTLRFARPDENGALTALIIGVGFGAGLMALGFKASRWVNLLILNILATSTALNAVLDIWYLLFNIGARRGNIRNDAVAYSQQITAGIVPPSIVALTWVLIAVGMFGWAIWWGVVKPLRAELNDTYEALKR